MRSPFVYPGLSNVDIPVTSPTGECQSLFVATTGGSVCVGDDYSLMGLGGKGGESAYVYRDANPRKYKIVDVSAMFSR